MRNFLTGALIVSMTLGFSLMLLNIGFKVGELGATIQCVSGQPKEDGK